MVLSSMVAAPWVKNARASSAWRNGSWLPRRASHSSSKLGRPTVRMQREELLPRWRVGLAPSVPVRRQHHVDGPERSGLGEHVVGVPAQLDGLTTRLASRDLGARPRQKGRQHPVPRLQQPRPHGLFELPRRRRPRPEDQLQQRVRHAVEQLRVDRIEAGSDLGMGGHEAVLPAGWSGGSRFNGRLVPPTSTPVDREYRPLTRTAPTPRSDRVLNHAHVHSERDGG